MEAAELAAIAEVLATAKEVSSTSSEAGGLLGRGASARASERFPATDPAVAGSGCLSPRQASLWITPASDPVLLQPLVWAERPRCLTRTALPVASAAAAERPAVRRAVAHAMQRIWRSPVARLAQFC